MEPMVTGLLGTSVGVIVKHFLDRSKSERERKELETKTRAEKADLELKVEAYKTELEKKAQEAHKLLEEASQRQYREKKIHLLFDGIKGAGKSTLLSRLVAPVVVGVPKMTTDSLQTPPLPVCFSPTKKELYLLVAHDVAGENSGTVIDALNLLAKEKTPGEEVVAIIMWDCSAPQEGRNKTELNRQRLQAVFQNAAAKNLIKNLYIFVNKIDARRKTDPTVDFEKIAEEAKSYIYAHVSSFGEPKVFYGSAETGEGVHRCYGQILHELKLTENFPAASMLGPTTPNSSKT